MCLTPDDAFHFPQLSTYILMTMSKLLSTLSLMPLYPKRRSTLVMLRTTLLSKRSMR